MPNMLSCLYRVVCATKKPRGKFTPYNTKEMMVRAFSPKQAAHAASDYLAETFVGDICFKAATAVVFKLHEPEVVGIVLEPAQTASAYRFSKGKPVLIDAGVIPVRGS